MILMVKEHLYLLLKSNKWGVEMYYAKPIDALEGSYDYHVQKSVEIYYKELDRNSEVIKKILDEIGYELNDFKLYSYLAISLHDLGKLSDNFQNQMKNKIFNLKLKTVKFRHELLSTLYMALATQNYLKYNKKSFPFHYFAVLSHHKKLDINFSSFFNERHMNENWPLLEQEEFEYGIDLSDKLARNKIEFIKDISKIRINKESIFRLLESYVLESYFANSNLSKSNIRILYSLYKGLLQYCDWIASSNKELIQPNWSQSELKNKIKKKVEAEGKIFVKRKFHKECAMATNDVVVIAPTGSGKTEASLLWASKWGKSKIIFLMPTMVTSNSIFKRLSKHYFKKEHCGLTHSNSDVYFAINSDYSEKERLELLQYKVFIPPVMVSTIDQILTSGFNTGYWCLKEYALVGSSIIIDEVHAYDTFTLALITETIKKVKKLQGHVMIMSATMPDFLLQHFTNLLGISEPIVAEELMDRKQSKWRFVDKKLDEIKSEIRSYINKGKKVAVIVNDVETAKRLFKEFSSDYKALCLHSEFIMKDRIEKEGKLEENNDYDIVISTQVMEVSLDISFNIMFSECAPIDSLVQRAGRCNRKGEYTDSEFIVFDYSDVSEKYVYRGRSDILIKTKEVIKKNQGYLSEREISQMVNEVYEGFNMYDENYNKGQQLYKEIIEEEIIFDLDYDEKRLQTRLIDNMKISIIPYVYKDIVEMLFEKGEYAKIALYEVPVSIGKFNKYIRKNYCENIYKLPVYTIDYNSDTGIVYNDNTFEMV